MLWVSCDCCPGEEVGFWEVAEGEGEGEGGGGAGGLWWLGKGEEGG